MKYHVFLISLGYKPSEVFNMHLDFTYTQNEGAFSPIVWSGIDPEAITRLVGSGQWDYDFTGVEDLSNLDVTTYDVSLGADYMFMDNLSVYSAIAYSKWEDDEWVLEDNTGDYLIGSLGFLISF